MPSDFDYIRELVQTNAAILLERSSEYMLASRLEPVAKGEGLADAHALVEKLRAEPLGPLHWKAIEALTTNETSFFRDIHPFDTLRRIVVPALLERRVGEKRLRIWSAACSTGQETYSIAMLLSLYFPQLAEWKVEIVGTDLSTAVLSRAEEGRFTQLETGRGLPATHLIKFFEKQGTHWLVREPLRKLVSFRPLNLVGGAPFGGPFDVVFLRNVLVYFSPEASKAIVERVRKAMARPGYLFLGSAESTGSLAGFRSVAQGKSVYFEAED